MSNRKRSIIRPEGLVTTHWLVVDTADSYVYDVCSTRAAARESKNNLGGLKREVTILKTVAVAEIR